MAPLTDACADLACALDRLSAALATGRPDAVLAAEEPLAHAVRRLRSCAAPRLDDGEAAAGVRSVRVALAACLALGRATATLAQAANQYMPYTANGQPMPPSVRATVESRT